MLSARPAGILLALLSCLLVARTALAQTDRDQARAKVTEGAKLLEAQQYAQALARFEEAFAIYPSAKIHYNLGRALAGLGRNAEAFTAFQRFLREADDATAQHQTHARRELDRLRALVGRVTVTSNVAGAEISVGGKPVGSTPLARPLAFDPGEHDITVRKDGYTAETRRYTAVAGQTTEVRFELREAAVTATTTAAEPPRPAQPDAVAVATTDVPAERRGRARTVPLIVGAAGGAVAAAGVVTWIIAGRKRGALEDDITKGRPLADGDLAWKTYDRAGVALMATGAAAMGAAAVVYFWRSPGESAVALAPVAGAHQAGVVVGGRF